MQLKAINVLIRLALAGATIFVIAAFMLGATPARDGLVADAEADVFFGTVDTTHTRFARVIEGSGLQVRPYALNGNVMYFAAGQTRKRPLEALTYYQAALVEEGVNSRDWSQHPTRSEAHARQAPAAVREVSEATLRGEVVPEVRSDNYVSMAGLVVDDVADRSAFVERGTSGGKFEFARATNGFRMIEAMWDPDVERTQITAVWTAPEFDEDKMENRAYLQSPPDTEVPGCAGCEREVAFESLDPDQPLRSDSYRTRSSVAATHAFYTSAMARKGWEPTGVQRKLDWLAAQLPGEPGLTDGKLLDLRHADGRTATIAILEDPAGGARVMTLRD